MRRYTAQELTNLAGFENVEFGKVRVRIGGISGIVKEDHKIAIQDQTKEIDITVGTETKKLEI